MRTILWILGFIIIFSSVATVVYFVSSYPGETDTPIIDPDEPDEEIGFYSQRLVVNYMDGTKSDDLITGYIYHDSKKIDSLTYQLYANPENDDRIECILQYYNFKYKITQPGNTVKTGRLYPDTVNRGIVGRTLLCEVVFDPFEFINYTYPDGVYTIEIIPSGEILLDNEQVNLPDPFSFTFEMIDERAIDIGFN